MGRCRKRTKAGVYTADITYDDLKTRFNMPSQKAAESLGVGLTIFKRLCRRFGLQKWPYRQLLKQQREGKRRGGSGGGHKEFGSGTSEDEDDDEDDGSDTESESEAPQSRKSARGGGGDGPPAAKRHKRGSSLGEGPDAAAAAPLAGRGIGGASSQPPPPPQRGEPGAQPDPSQPLPPGGGSAWGDGFARYQHRPSSAPAWHDSAPRAAGAHRPGDSGADAAALAGQQQQQQQPQQGVRQEQGGSAGQDSIGASFQTLWHALLRDAPPEKRAALLRREQEQDRELLQMREALLRQYAGGGGGGSAGPAPGAAAQRDAAAPAPAPPPGQPLRPKPLLPAASQEQPRPATGSLSSAFLDSLLPSNGGYSSLLSPGSGLTPSSRQGGASSPALPAWAAAALQREPGLGLGGGEAAFRGGGVGALGSRASGLGQPPSASLLLSAAAAGVSLPLPSPLPSPLPPPSAGAGGGDLAAAAAAALPRASSASWWALDSPLDSMPGGGGSTASGLDPPQPPAALELEQRALRQQGAALTQLIGSLKREISVIEQRSTALAAEAERARRFAAEAAAAQAGRAAALRRQRAEQARQLAALQAQAAGSAGLTPSESLVLMQLIGGLQQEIADIERQLAALAARERVLTAPPAAPPPLGLSRLGREGAAAAAAVGYAAGYAAAAGGAPPHQTPPDPGMGFGNSGSGPLSSPSTAMAYTLPESLHLSGSAADDSPDGVTGGLSEPQQQQQSRRGGGDAAAAADHVRGEVQLAHLQALLGRQGAAAGLDWLPPSGKGGAGFAPAPPSEPSVGGAEADLLAAAAAAAAGGGGNEDAAASAFLARMTAVHCLQQRLASRHAQRRQREQAEAGAAAGRPAADPGAQSLSPPDAQQAAAATRVRAPGSVQLPPGPFASLSHSAAAAADPAPRHDRHQPAPLSPAREPELSLAYQLGSRDFSHAIATGGSPPPSRPGGSPAQGEPPRQPSADRPAAPPAAP